MALMLPPVAVWLHHQPGAVKANQALYDRMLAWRTPAANAQMLVIGIDARSLREIGPWPWPRRVHAELLAREMEGGSLLDQGGPEALRLFADTAGWVAQYTQRPAAAMEVPA